MTNNKKDVNSLAKDTNILLPDGFTPYVDPPAEIDPTASEATRTELALGQLSIIHTGGIAQAGRQKPSDSPHATMEIVALDPKGMPILMKPSVESDGTFTDGKINVSFEVSSDPIVDQHGNVIGHRPRRPLLDKPPTHKQYHADPTDASRKAAKHMDHAAHVRDEHLLRARRKFLVTASYTTPQSLGIEDETLAQFDSTGQRVNPDPVNPKLRSFNQLSHGEKLRMFLAMEPSKFDEKVARNALKVYEDSLKKGVKYHGIVRNHGHHPVWYNPLTWRQGHGHDEHGHNHESHVVTPLEDAKDISKIVKRAFFKDATPAERDTFHNLVDQHDPDHVEDIVDIDTASSNLSPKLKLAIKAAGQVNRERQVRDADAAWELALETFITSKQSRYNKRLFDESTDFLKRTDLVALINLAGRPNLSPELREFLRATEDMILKEREAKHGAYRVRQQAITNNELREAQATFDSADEAFIATRPDSGLEASYYTYMAMSADDIETYITQPKPGRPPKEFMHALQAVVELKRKREKYFDPTRTRPATTARLIV